jgi:hypothetical protein
LSTVRLNGIQRYSQARREAIERYNKLTLADLSFQATVFDTGIKHSIGDVVEMTLPFGGITGKQMRVMAVTGAGPGLWNLDMREYQPNAYSTAVETRPTYSDTELENPNDPPDLTALSATQDLYQVENGIWLVRAALTITPPTFFWTAGYDIEVWEGTTLVHTGHTVQTTYRTPALQDLKTYTVKARLVSTIGATGAWKETSFTADGKTATPGDVPSISGFEVAGEVYLTWGAASDLDIWRYELRWGDPGTGSWANSQLLDRVDALRYVSRGVLTAGTHRIWIKAMDSVRQYSTNAVYVDVTVTIDPDALQTIYDLFTPGTPTDMSSTTFGMGNDTYYITEHGNSVASIFTADPLGTSYDAQPVAAYQSNATNEYLTSIWDASVDLTGDWTCELVYEKFSTDGTCVLTLQLATTAAYPVFTDYTTLPVKTTARYARLKVSGTGEFKIKAGSESVTCYAVTQKEYGVKSCAATGTNTVSLDNAYFKYRSITLTPVEAGTTAIIAVADNIVLDPDGSPVNSFDIYTFDAAGARIAADVAWKFEGV